jgi:K+-sensing histidine kinase KdpD
MRSLVRWPDDAVASGKVVSERLLVVHGDPVQLLRLFHELVGNGIVHSASSSRVVEVRVDHKELQSKMAADLTCVVIGASGNGAGVPEQHGEEIFAAFRTLKRVGDASGLRLGLANSLRIVRRQGGNLRCLERQGSGSQFVFDLPLPREHSEDADDDAC